MKGEILFSEHVLQFAFLFCSIRIAFALKRERRQSRFKKKSIPGLCFAEGTKIATSSGSKNIESIEVGDEVWAFDEATGEKALKEVINTVVKQSDHLQKLIIGSDTLLTTDDHPFYLDGNWVPSRDLKVGDSLNLLNGEKQILAEKDRIDTLVTVYNFAVADFSTYFVGGQGILVHNNNPCATAGKWRRGIVESIDATKVLDKLPPSLRKNVDDAIELVRTGKAGGNQHNLGKDLKGYKAIDAKGTGKGRGGLRVVYKETDDEIYIHSIQNYH